MIVSRLHLHCIWCRGMAE